ncbi:DUF983 domain-containing protein [Hymenobacter sp. BT730]|uniref:DUF983 domain-containing protein n=1 Tax=Hymenobacter sp. BT730 TaxID=3063332 RepID=UPI0026E08631|nr:DUF983 domain-containing protein [Hymenobacter sp. BT730]
MAGTSSTWLAIMEQKCPRCQQGPLFLHSAYNLSKFDEMPERCPICGQHYEPEVGFYWGAMYISYGLSVGVVLVVGLLLYFIAHDPAVWVYIGAVSITMLALTPLLFRYARTLMLYLFGSVRYQPDAPLQPPHQP